jgi:hypothetical protein
MEQEHKYSDVENNEDSIADDVDVVEGNVPSIMTDFINRINDAKDIFFVRETRLRTGC